MKYLGGLLFVIAFFQNAIAEELTKEQKRDVVEKIYAEVYAALGSSKEAPSLYFETNAGSSAHIAFMDFDTDGYPRIGFEMKAFDVCQKLGNRRDDAIAFLLGHEISHHVMEHHWGEEFRSAYSLSSLGRDIKLVDLSSSKKFEAQADERGGILCYMAGYTTAGIGEQLLKLLYEAYGLKDGPDYPTLDERVKIARETDSLVSTYIKVFETANYAMLIGEYQLAIDGYKYVTSKGFHSPEIYNNFGVAYFLQGSSAAGADEMKYIYPVEIDLQSKLRGKGSKGMGSDAKKLFENALKKFKQATAFDENYATGYLNMACTYAVLENLKKARFFAGEAIEKGTTLNLENTVLNAKMLNGIVEDKDTVDGSKSAAIKIFDDLIFQGHILSGLNKKIVEGADLTELNPPNMPIAWMDGKTDDVAAKPGFAKPEPFNGFKDFNTYELGEVIPTTTEEQIVYKQGSVIVTGEMEDSKVYVAQDKNGNWLGFYVTSDNYQSETAYGVKLRDSKEAVIEKYGLPTSVTSAQQGTLFYYHKNRIIFLIDRKNELKQWILFKKL